MVGCLLRSGVCNGEVFATVAMTRPMLKGRSKLSTFFKVYRGYARGGGVGDHRTHKKKNQHLMLITDNKSTFYGKLLGSGDWVLQKSTLYAFIKVDNFE